MSLPNVPSEVGDPSRCEDQRGVLAVKVGEFGFELDMLPVGPGDVARASRSGTRQIDGAMHGGQHIRMLAHAEVVIAAPDGNATAPTIGSVPQGRGKLPGEPLELDEGPIAAIQLHCADEAFELGDMVHTPISEARGEQS